MKDNLKAGNVLCMVKKNRRETESEIFQVEVLKVGRKYFTVREDWREYTFEISSWKEKRGKNAVGNSCLDLYKDLKEYEESLELKEWEDLVVKAFRWETKKTFTLEQLREAGKALGLELKKKDSIGIQKV